jgi:small subunit ribosomal protein S17e
MGRIKTQQIKRTARKLMELHKKDFKEDFGPNKILVSKYAEIQSKKLRNIVAGYVTRLKKQKED